MNCAAGTKTDREFAKLQRGLRRQNRRRRRREKTFDDANNDFLQLEDWSIPTVAMKKSRFISILVSIALIGCALSKDEKDKLIPVFQPDLLLTQDEEARDLLSATRGDPCAAFRLSEHYWALNRKEEMTFWLKKAAVWGHPIAQYNLGVFYEKYFEPRDADGAQYWFARAKGAERESAKCSP